MNVYIIIILLFIFYISNKELFSQNPICLNKEINNLKHKISKMNIQITSNTNNINTFKSEIKKLESTLQ